MASNIERMTENDTNNGKNRKKKKNISHKHIQY